MPAAGSARRAAREGNSDAHRALLTFVKRFTVKEVRRPNDPPFWFGELREAMRADGYELRWDYITDDNEEWNTFTGKASLQVLPTDATAIPLASEISALEAELADHRYLIALNHYQQAVDNLLQHNVEAANSQLRTMLEDLVVSVAEENGYVGQGKAGQGGQAIQYLVYQAKLLPERDGGMLLQGLWMIAHTNGPHPGQSDAREARLRMQLITGTAQFLLNHFPNTP